MLQNAMLFIWRHTVKAVNERKSKGGRVVEKNALKNWVGLSEVSLV